MFRQFLKMILVIAVCHAVFSLAETPRTNGPPRLAVVGLLESPDTSGPLGERAKTVMALLEVELLKRNDVELVERQEIDRVWRELNLSTLGEASDRGEETLLKLGRLLRADQIVWGKVKREVAGHI